MRILPLFIPHQGCPFSCIYCNQYSITKADSETKRDFKGLIADFCSQKIIEEKEIAFFGGTFTALDIDSQIEYLNLIKPYLSDIKGIRISTRPDCINAEKLIFLKKSGVTTIELGIQSFDNLVLKASKREYSADKAVNACNSVTEFGFELVIQLMPGLPEDTLDTYLKSINKAISLHPQGLRLYPTIVLKQTVLEKWYLKGDYTPISLTEAINWLKISIIKCRKAEVNIIKMGLHSDIKPSDIVAGPYHPALGELVRIDLLYDKLIDNWQSSKTLVIPIRWKSLFLGHQRLLIKKLKDKLLLDKIAVRINKDKEAVEYSFDESIAQYIW